MKSSSSKFLVMILIVSSICGVLQIVWNNQATKETQLNHGFLLLVFFAVTVTAVHFFLLNSAKGKPQNFVKGFLGSTVFKFFLYIGVLFLFLFLGSGNKQILILHFIFYYAAFTLLEVAMLYIELKKIK